MKNKEHGYYSPFEIYTRKWNSCKLNANVIIQRFSRLASRIHREVSSIPTRRSAEVLLVAKKTAN